jgi:hypothetical protein
MCTYVVKELLVFTNTYLSNFMNDMMFFLPIFFILCDIKRISIQKTAKCVSYDNRKKNDSKDK